MTKSIWLSDEQHWSAQFGLFEWVVEFLMEAVDDPPTREHFQEVIDHNLPGVDVRKMPVRVREQVMRALAEDLETAVDSSLAPVVKTQLPESQGRMRLGHLKGLGLMARDVLRRQAERTDQRETGR
ncbi:MAG: hypothetical protein QOI83_4666 [Streptomycetaceae bacterium]|nr:hypothetical protein [Streptomycetaceae bacterium]